MKKEKKRRMCGVLIFFLLTLSLVGCKEEKAPKSYEYVQSETVVTVETDELQITIEKGILEEKIARDWAVYRLEQAYNNAKDFLGEGYSLEEKLRCCIYAGDGLTQISENALDIYFYETVEQPYTNYMIQVMAGINVQDWLREGLAAYGADMTGESLLDSYGSVLPELDAMRTAEDGEKAEYADVSALARVLYESGSFEDALVLGDMLKTMSSMETPDEAARYRVSYCIYAGSFVQYLAKNEGLDQVLRVYNGEEFESVMGQSVIALQKEWIAGTLK